MSEIFSFNKCNSLKRANILFLLGSSILPFDIPYASKDSLFMGDSNFLAGTPTYVVLSGTSLMTTALAPILDPLPMKIGPRICAPDPMMTLSPTVGCL